jgi:hypothetical protein
MIYAVKIDIIIFNIKLNIEDDEVVVPGLILRFLRL